MQSWSTISGFAIALSLVGCAAAPPPPAHWVQGGAPLELPNAQWNVADEVITMHPNGLVQRNGEFELTIDRAGRIYDEDNEPIALLESDGRLVGTSDADLGRVGAVTASLPGSDVAWLAVDPDGHVTYFAPSGERQVWGAWTGCNATARTALACTLTTHVLSMKFDHMTRADSGSFGIGIGVGVGVGFGAGSYGGASFTPRPPFAPGPIP